MPLPTDAPSSLPPFSTIKRRCRSANHITNSNIFISCPRTTSRPIHHMQANLCKQITRAGQWCITTQRCLRNLRAKTGWCNRTRNKTHLHDIYISKGERKYNDLTVNLTTQAYTVTLRRVHETTVAV